MKGAGRRGPRRYWASRCRSLSSNQPSKGPWLRRKDKSQDMRKELRSRRRACSAGGSPHPECCGASSADSPRARPSVHDRVRDRPHARHGRQAGQASVVGRLLWRRVRQPRISSPSQVARGRTTDRVSITGSSMSPEGEPATRSSVAKIITGSATDAGCPVCAVPSTWSLCDPGRDRGTTMEVRNVPSGRATVEPTTRLGR